METTDQHAVYRKWPPNTSLGDGDCAWMRIGFALHRRRDPWPEVVQTIFQDVAVFFKKQRYEELSVSFIATMALSGAVLGDYVRRLEESGLGTLASWSLSRATYGEIHHQNNSIGPFRGVEEENRRHTTILP